MFLFKLEIELEDQTVYLVTAAESEEQAFDGVEAHLVRYFVGNPAIKDCAIVEKKRLEKGAGYVIETGSRP
ncbi:DUF3906 family protein [Paenibacillus mesophilus]|uniref:DUF3906 family protein n=1 Tax=Paenibacillus mesophilus TaxID=2582849 RepID=UPI00110D645B|nr:DUF3906 family protein [Paenibacillus mesophilus]TMV47755.1 DUF3906 family protein [Paenibacillus mesophilus]